MFPLFHGLLHGLAVAGLLLAAGSVSAGEWFSESGTRGYEYTGPYAQFGISIGQINYDEVRKIDVDSEASGGFTIAGGYRFLPWLAADANFTFLGGHDNVELDIPGKPDGDSQFWAFTFGPKLYPLGAFEVEAMPHWVQPYALIAIGGGEGETDIRREVERSGFVARFILGFDIWANDHIGMFVEGGGHVTDEDTVDGIGIFTFGGQYRF